MCKSTSQLQKLFSLKFKIGETTISTELLIRSAGDPCPSLCRSPFLCISSSTRVRTLPKSDTSHSSVFIWDQHGMELLRFHLFFYHQAMVFFCSYFTFLKNTNLGQFRFFWIGTSVFKERFFENISLCLCAITP